MNLPVLQQGPMCVRHIKSGLSTDPGAIQVLDRWFTPQDLRGLNGAQGFQAGKYQLRINEEGDFSLTLPNEIGGDGTQHRLRFALLTDPSYRGGDEWIEVYNSARPTGEPEFVGTPTSWSLARGQLEITGADGVWLLKHSRETAAGFWTGQAPRDVVENYSNVWQMKVLEDFGALTFAYLATEQTTADGRFDYRRARSAGGYCELYPSVSESPGTEGAYLTATETFDVAAGRWRVEAECERNLMGTLGYFELSLVQSSGGAAAYVRIYETLARAYSGGVGFGTYSDLGADTEPGVTRIAIEGDRRWMYVYLDGVLKTPILPVFDSGWGDLSPRIALARGNNTEAYLRVRNLTLRSHVPFLVRGAAKGDYHLPGAPPPDGLSANYMVDADMAAKHGAKAYIFVANPTRTGTRKGEPTIDYTSTAPSQTVRWTGAIYLDLLPFDRRLRITADDRARVWVGKTRFGEQIIDDWLEGGHSSEIITTGPWLRSLLGTVAGWFPIVVEVSNDAGSMRALLEHNASTEPPTVWYTCGDIQDVAPYATPLSPLGCFEGQVRFESHYEQLRQVLDTFALQATCEPRSLESGEFPGQLIPKVRAGRDTSEVLDSRAASGISSEGTCEDAVDQLLAEGAGISDPVSGAQLSIEKTNYLQAGNHLLLHQEQESLADIAVPSLLQQRLESLMALRSAAWEEVSAQPFKKRDLLEGFPLGGALAKFKWGAGDGVRLDLPELGVLDRTARQILGVEWPFVPDGLGTPSVTFRQRPRNFREALLRLQRTAVSQARNYQGQLVVVPGSQGGNSVAAADARSRVSLPDDLGKVVRAEFIVTAKDDATSMSLVVNGVTRGAFTTVGRYDVSEWVAGAPGEFQMYASAGGGTGAVAYALELLVSV